MQLATKSGIDRCGGDKHRIFRGDAAVACRLVALRVAVPTDVQRTTLMP